ncbi:PAS domain-containing protein [Natrarchaeobius chitinivorans]|uniref:histidine kinase n=1 Tax=Natrarchaeobius chitinivorans TaxID=1679083 RepID=A0A3N6NFS1_NATCH|nr:PAS domain-containing protein [Natrarchaeobius chitinivorans]RQG97832.1 PAS domain S-box protein [Natrarchaeobius chitinivorans]
MIDSVSILHVDTDSESAVQTATHIARENDRFAVETATSATEGLDSLEDDDVDCVVSSYEIGDRNGIDFLEDVRDRYPDLPFILFPTRGSETVASKAVSHGATDYLRRTGDSDQYELLANRIANAAEQFRAKRSERWLAELAETTDRILFVFSSDWEELEFINSAYADLWGRPVEALRENPADFLNGIHPDDRDDVREAMAAISGGEPVEIEFRVDETQAFDRWVRVRGEPMFDDDGTVVRVAGFVTDVTEQKRRERTLREAKIQLETATEAGAVGTWEWNIPENRLVAGPEFARTFDVDPDAMQEGVPVERAVSSIHDDDRERIETAIEATVDACGEYEQEYRVRNTDDEYRWMLARGHVDCDADGNPITFTGALTDITDRKRTERELQRHQAFLEESTDVVTVVDVDGTIEYHSPSVDRTLGYDRGDLIGADAFGKVHPDDRPNLLAAFEALLEEPGASEREEARFRTADGEWRWLEVHGTNQLADPVVDGIVINSRDITERKRQQRDRKTLLEFLHQLYDVTTDVELSLEGKISRLLGRGSEHLDLPYAFLAEIDRDAGEGGTQTIVEARDPHDRLKPGESRPLSQAFCRATIDADDTMVVADATANGSSGEPTDEPFELGCYIGGRVQVDGDLYGTLCFGAEDSREEFTDGEQMIVRLMNKWMSYELERKRATRELEQSNDRLASFASVVSHDLRNPLNVAEGHLELARTNRDSKHLEEAAAALDRIETLVDDLLTLAREGSTAIEPEPIRLSTVINRCWETVETPNATLNVETNRTVSADRTRLKQILENLVRNSVDHVGGDVSVTIRDVDGGFAVEDDGPGIPSEKRDRVFETGYTTAQTGTGLGLQIVEQAATDHGWSLRLTEGPDGGARFEFTDVDVLGASSEGNAHESPSSRADTAASDGRHSTSSDE